MKATCHHQRVSKATGKAFNPNHNDRQFRLTAASRHIDPAKQDHNVYVTWDGSNTFKQAEIHYYERFQAHVDATNARYIKEGHKERCRSLDEYRRHPRTCPEETLLQIGKVGDSVTPEQFKAVLAEYIQEHNKLYPQCVILDIAVHDDERDPDAPDATPTQAHVRCCWTAHDANGDVYVCQNQALKEMGVNLPDPKKDESKRNNRKMIYTATVRQLFESICTKHGIILDTDRLPKEEVGKSLTVYKRRQEEKRLNAIQQEIAKCEIVLDEKEDKIRKLDDDITTKQEYNQQLKETKQKIYNYTSELPEPFTRKLPERIYESTLLGKDVETDESKKHRIDAQKKKNEDIKACVVDMQHTMNAANEELRLLQIDHTTLQRKYNELKQELEDTKQQLKVERSMNTSYVDLEPIRAIDVEDLLQRRGYILDKKCSCASSRCYRDGDRKVIVKPSTQEFIDAKDDTEFRGHGPIDLEMCLRHGKKSQDKEWFLDACHSLMEDYGIEQTAKEIGGYGSLRRPANNMTVTRVVKEVEKKNRTLPLHCNNKESQAITFLLRRGIEVATTKYLIQSQKKLKSGEKVQQIIIDAKGNINIPRECENGYMQRGTYGQNNEHKWNYGRKEAGPAMLHGKDAKEDSPIIICEGVTDGITLCQMRPDCHIAIIGGNLRPDIRRKDGQKVILAFDNDEIGRMDIMHYSEIFGDAEIMSPPDQYNDWSEWQQHHRDNERIEEERRRREEEIKKQLQRESEDTDPKPHL